MGEPEEAGPGGRPGSGAREKEEANPMYSNIIVVFNFIISQWSLSFLLAYMVMVAHSDIKKY